MGRNHIVLQRAAFRSPLERILQFPHAWVLVGERTRRALVDRFPYGILYYIHGEVIVVTAVMNLRQKPRSLD